MAVAISDDDLACYREQGYLVVPGVLSESELDLIRTELLHVVDGSARVTENDDTYDLEPGHTAAAPKVRRIKEPHVVMPSVADLVRHPVLVHVLTRLLGPGVRFQTSKLNMKSPGGGSAVEWHQDWAFYPHTNDDVLAVGMLLEDTATANGPLMVVPGTHRGPVLDHHHDGVFCGAIDPRDPLFEKDKAVSLTGRAGTITVHHARTLHGSAPNHSDRARLLLLYECVAADAWPLAGASSLFNGKSADEVWEIMTGRMVAGAQTPVPRFADAPARLPLPPAPDSTSIFKIQKSGRAASAFGEAA